jgi:hypothetical protein
MALMLLSHPEEYPPSVCFSATTRLNYRTFASSMIRVGVIAKTQIRALPRSGVMSGALN